MIVNRQALLKAAPIRDMLETKERSHGVSHGLAEAGYDIRIKQDITFVQGGTHRYLPILESLEPREVGFTHTWIEKHSVIIMPEEPGIAEIRPGRFIIASALEEFSMPDDLVGVVHDKSTWARRGLSVFNTVIEPGWKGFLTLELIYHGEDDLHIPAGTGIAQVLFSRIEETAAYDGKYQHQANRPVAAILEKG